MWTNLIQIRGNGGQIGTIRSNKSYLQLASSLVDASGGNSNKNPTGFH